MSIDYRAILYSVQAYKGSVIDLAKRKVNFCDTCGKRTANGAGLCKQCLAFCKRHGTNP